MNDENVHEHACKYYFFCRCNCENCNSDRLKNVEKAIARLNSLSDTEQAHISEKYYGGNMPWKGLQNNENQN